MIFNTIYKVNDIILPQISLSLYLIDVLVWLCIMKTILGVKW